MSTRGQGRKRGRKPQTMSHEGNEGGEKKRGWKCKVKEEQEKFGVLKLMNVGNEDDVNDEHHRNNEATNGFLD